MENNEQNVKVKEKKGGTGFLVFIIVVLLIIIGVGVGWYFGKNGTDEGKKQENNTTNNATETIANKTNETEKIENKTNKTNTTENNKEMTAEERYAIYSKNLQNDIKEMGKDLPEELNIFFNQKGVLSIDVFPANGTYINEKLEAYVTIKETGDRVKILDNAIDCGIAGSGNGGTLYVIWAVDTEGNLYTQNYDTNDTANRMKFSLTQNAKFKNVVSIVQCSGPSAKYPVVIDIDGNTHELFE